MAAEDTTSIRTALKRCSPDCIDAAIRFRETGDVTLIPVVINGVAERFLEPDMRPLLKSGDDGLRIMEDLGIDSLALFEIVVLMEQVFGFAITNRAIASLRTLGDVKEFIAQQATHAFGLRSNEREAGAATIC